MTTPAPRSLRLCDVCGLQDSDPRHVRTVPPDYPGAVPDKAFLEGLAAGADPVAVAELLDPTTVVRHIHCDAQDGCTSCSELVTASGNATGQALLDFIQNQGA